jgi:hypothetical protein
MLTEYSYNDAGKLVGEFSVRCCPFCRSKLFVVEEEARIVDLKYPTSDEEFKRLITSGYEVVNIDGTMCLGLLRKPSEVTP